MEETTQQQWSYDFNSFTVPTADIDLDDVNNNPEKYLTYDPTEKVSNEEKIINLTKENEELKENLNLLSDCVMELSEKVYS